MSGSITGVSLGSAAQIIASAPAQADPGKGTAAAPPAPSPAQTPAGFDAVQQLAQAIEANVIVSNTTLEFSTYGKSGEQIAITVSDKETGRVIRELPPKEIQRLYEKLNEMAGEVIDKKA